MTDRSPRSQGIAIHASAGAITSGGGLTYVTALAAALADADDVDLFLRFPAAPAELGAWLPDWPRRARLQREPPNRSWRDECWLALQDRRWAVTVRDTSDIPPLSLARRAVLLTSFPFSTVARRRDRRRLASYGTVIVNSAFTARWVAARWGRPAHVLHPPILPVTPGPKRRMILAVGRFSDGGRSKRQLEMVDTFRALGTERLRDWSLHLAGFVEDPAYVRAVQERAAGLPVTIHADVDRLTLDELYGSAAIFWHACGLGVDEEREPQRVEHFGITTAEAMSAGCVPIVIDAGGQPEIVGRDERAGQLWQTTEQWAAATARVIDDPRHLERLAAAARAHSERFTFSAFAPRARSLVHGLPSPDGPGA